VFTQKITPDERILAAVLYQRGLCSQDTLAELFEVGRRTIGNVVREVSPALTQDGYTPTPVGQRLPDAQAVIDAATRHS
jgi:transcriptional antiterminator